MITSAKYLTSLDEDEFEDVFIVIDHRDLEEDLIESVSKKIQESLEPYRQGEELWISLAEQKYRIPITLTRHDRYVAISSLAEILVEKYSFWLDKHCLEDDTHYVLVLSKQVSDDLMNNYADFLNEKLIELKLGYDYFNGIDIPYYSNESHNPDFQWESEQLDQGLHMLRADLVKQKLQHLKNKKWWHFWK